MNRIERPVDFRELRNLLRKQPLEVEDHIIVDNVGFRNSRGRQALAFLGVVMSGMFVAALTSPPAAENIFACIFSAAVGSASLATAANKDLYQKFRECLQDGGRDFDRLRGLSRNLGGNEGFRESIFPRRLQEIDNQVPYRMQNENQHDISAASLIRVPDVFESSCSNYRLAVEHFVENIPNNATANEILTRINSYYNLASDERDVRDFQNSLVSEFGESRKTNTQAYYIDDSALSKAVFASLVGSCICHGGRLPQDNEEYVGNLIAKVATISQEQKDLLKAGVNEYLENEYTQNQDINKKLFLLAGYKMLNSVQYINNLGEETFKVIVSPRAVVESPSDQPIRGAVLEAKDSKYSELNQLEEGDRKPSGTIKPSSSSAYSNNSRVGGASL